MKTERFFSFILIIAVLLGVFSSLAPEAKAAVIQYNVTDGYINISDAENTLGSKTSTTIRGYDASTAEKYAAKYGYAFESLGAYPPAESECSHIWSEETVTKESTCAQRGEICRTCTRCGEVRTENLDALGHNFSDGKCDRCGALWLLSHAVSIYTSTYGKVMTTAVTNASVTANASPSVIVAADATCNAEGYLECKSENVACFQMETVDGLTSFITSDGKYLSMGDGCLGFADKPGKYTAFVLEESENGYLIRGENASSEFGLKPHYLEYFAPQGYFAPNRLQEDVLPYYTFRFVPLAPQVCLHQWDNGIVLDKPTCTKAGIVKCTCALCGETQTRELAPTGHSFSYGACTNCGTTWHYWDSVAIYAPAFGRVMTTELIEPYTLGNHFGTLLGSAEAAIDANGYLVSDAGNVASFRMQDEHGIISFVTADGKYLHLDERNLCLADEEGEFTTFVLEEAENGCYIKSENACYPSAVTPEGYPQYLEYYPHYEAFTTYRLREHALQYYTFAFVPLSPMPCNHQWETVAMIQKPTCVEYGYERSKCRICGEETTRVLAALGHDVADGICQRCNVSFIDPFTLASQIEDGAEILIYSPYYDIVLGEALADGWPEPKKTGMYKVPGFLHGVPAEHIENGLIASEGVAVLTVKYAEDGTFTLQRQDEKYLSASEAFCDLNFTEEKSAHSQWKLIADRDNTFRLDAPYATDSGGVAASLCAVNTGAFTTDHRDPSTLIPNDGYRFEIYIKNPTQTEEPSEPSEEPSEPPEEPSEPSEQPSEPSEENLIEYKGFRDVTENDWFCKNVIFAVQHGLMNGVGDERFDPNGKVTRAMLVTIIYRNEGEPTLSSAVNPFADVRGDQWYTKAVVWAAENGIVKGMSQTAFAPDNAITREQIATILYRYAHFSKVDLTQSITAELSAYPDHSKVSGYAHEAVGWAVGIGIINGMDGKLAPNEPATRAQIAAMLMRYIENING